MLFNSLIFVLFAGLVFPTWFALRERSALAKQIFLCCASAVFYGWWNVSYLWLIAISGLIDYSAALGMGRFPGKRRVFLLCSLAGNLGLLGAFKYAGFFARNIDQLAANAGLSLASEAALPPLLDVLPVGISFYTFQSMSYTIDVYRGRLEPTRNLAAFFAYLSLFPQLVAGPIVRAADLLPEVLRPTPPRREDLEEGLRLLVYGFVKKVVLADGVAPYVDAAFAGGNHQGSAAYWWLVSALFAVQIYGDFSGYTDIARGLGRWLGFRFPVNFNHPYLASSLRDFWTRWHISLSSWFRDYVYIPLGGSRRGKAWGLAAMAVTMLLSGLWHGAGWTFIAWGALHAGFLAVERLGGLPQRLGGGLIARALTLAVVLLAWVLFRAENIGQAGQIMSVMLGLNSGEASPLWALTTGPVPLALLAGFALSEIAALRGLGFDRLEPALRQRLEPVALAGLALMAILCRGPAAQFIYFQF